MSRRLASWPVADRPRTTKGRSMSGPFFVCPWTATTLQLFQHPSDTRNYLARRLPLGAIMRF